MSNSRKLFYIIFPLVNLVYLICVIIFMIYLMAVLIPYNRVEHQTLLHTFVPLQIVFGIVNFTFFVLYLIHVIKNDRISQKQKVIWVLLIYFVNVFVIPFYWYNYIWKVE